MAFGSKRNVVLTDYLSLEKSGLSLSSLSPVTPAASFSASTLSHSPSSTLVYLTKIFPNNIENDNWVVAMKASERILASRFNHFELDLDMADTTYGSLMVDHPSALRMFEQMIGTLINKMGHLLCCIKVKQSIVAMEERFGHFDKFIEPRCHCLPCFFGSLVGVHPSLQVPKLDMRCESKSKDNVFVTVIDLCNTVPF